MSDPPLHTPAPAAVPPAGKAHARRLREVYRSAGWPVQDALEVELLAAGLLERLQEGSGHERVRVTEPGLRFLAQAFQHNRQALSRHDALVAQVAQLLLREGRIVWSGLALRAPLPGLPLLEADAGPAATRWKLCRPDLFSIRNTSVAAYLEPVVHEIKVSRADLLGDLRSPDKRDSYLGVGACWYVLGCDARGAPIAQPEEIPETCGVMVARPDGRLAVERFAPRPVPAELPFPLWMALAKATPLPPLAAGELADPAQALLGDPGAAHERP